MSRASFRLQLLFAVFLLALSTEASRAMTSWSILINTNNIFYVTNATYGAVADGVTTNTTAIQAAINAATKGISINGLTGGTVELPAPGVYLCGPLTLSNNVNLQVDAGAILRMLPFAKYPGSTNNPANFISANNQTNIEISGSGAIDGQGAPWWPYANTNGASRPIMIRLNSCHYELIQNITLSNSPEFHISISGSAANTTVQGVTVRAPSSEDPLTPGHNTDACDVSGTNILVQNNNISVGDDNFTCGGNTSDILITNNTYGAGHGVSIGSFTSPYVSNMLVINCTFNGTDQGIRIKSDRDRGGFVHNINYYNLSMTNVMHPILIYCQYTNTTPAYRALDSISPQVAESYPPAPFVLGKTPMYRDITISNVTATGQSGRAAGLVWGLPESSVSNLTLIKVNLSADTKTFGIYDAQNVKLIDCSHIPSAAVNQFSFFNSQVIFSNSTPSSTVVTLDGATTNAVPNSFSFYNYLAALKSTNALDQGSAIFLNNSTFTISNNLALSPSNLLNFVVGTNAPTLAVKGNLNLGGNVIITASGGFTNGTYPLISYTGTLGGTLPTVSSVPFGYSCAFDTGTSGLIKLTVTNASSQIPSTPTGVSATAANALVNLSWSAVPTATNYLVQRSTISGGSYALIGNTSGITYADNQVTNGITYYYVVAAQNGIGTGSDSLPVFATPQMPATNGAAFSDAFAASTVNSSSPSAPTPSGTGYQIISSKSWNPLPQISPGHFQFGIGTTASGIIEAQALFTTNPVALASIGDSISLVVIFTNTSGLLTESGSIGFGLYNSGQNFPVPGGLDSTLLSTVTTDALGNAQTWAGYVGQISFTGMNSQIITRPPQTGTANNNQDTVSTGSSSSYVGATTVGSASATPSLTLTTGSPYTEVFTVTLAGTNSLAITNSFYAGTSTNGTLLSQFGGVASGSTYLTNTFDSLAIGWRAQASTFASTIDINQITVNAVPASQQSIPSLSPAPLTMQALGNQLQLSWPADHLGWRLQMQTNDPVTGLGNNWITVPNSTNVTSTNITVSPTDGNIFFRLVYP